MRPSPPQVSQMAERTSWPKAVRETAWSWPEPWQRGHVSIGVPGLGAVAVAGVAARVGVVGDLDLLAVRGLLERDLHGDRHVPALHRPAARTAAAAERGVEAAGAEEGREEVGDRPEVAEVRGVAAAAQAFVAVGVVLLPAIGVRQHLVGLGRLLELGLGVRVVGVDVGVQLARQPPERLLDRRLVGVARDAEHLVVVARHYS